MEITEEVVKFEDATQKNVEKIHSDKMLVSKDDPFIVNRDESKTNDRDKKEMPHEVACYGFPENAERPINSPSYRESYPDCDMESAYMDSIIDEEGIFSILAINYS